MGKKLIIVADDFGFSEAYSIGALKAYKEGVVTVLSLMSNMETSSKAVAIAKKENIKPFEIVQHINFVQGKPCSRAVDVPTMVDENGIFYRSSKWKSEDPFNSKCVGNVIVSKEDCKTEAIAQIERFKKLTGFYPSHFEGHSVFTKNVREAFSEIAIERNIHCSFMPEKETSTMYAAHEIAFENPDYNNILNRGVRPDDFLYDTFGILSSPFDINILHFHPGFIDEYLLKNTSLTLQRCRDLETLCDPEVKRWIKDNDIELVDFSAVYKNKKKTAF